MYRCLLFILHFCTHTTTTTFRKFRKMKYLIIIWLNLDHMMWLFRIQVTFIFEQKTILSKNTFWRGAGQWSILGESLVTFAYFAVFKEKAGGLSCFINTIKTIADWQAHKRLPGDILLLFTRFRLIRFDEVHTHLYCLISGHCTALVTYIF